MQKQYAFVVHEGRGPYQDRNHAYRPPVRTDPNSFLHKYKLICNAVQWNQRTADAFPALPEFFLKFIFKKVDHWYKYDWAQLLLPKLCSHIWIISTTNISSQFLAALSCLSFLPSESCHPDTLSSFPRFFNESLSLILDFVNDPALTGRFFMWKFLI